MPDANGAIISLAITVAIVFLFLLMLVAVVYFLYQKKHRSYCKQLANTKNIYEQSLLQTRLEIQEQTFQDISREIHDNIGLILTLAKFQLNSLDYSSKKNIAEQVNYSVHLISKAINDLGDISKSLHSEAIKTHGLYNTIKATIEKINRTGKYHAEFIENGNAVFLDANKELILYRIVQEALNNILKHANATHIWIKLFYHSNHLSMCIEDNGDGFDILRKNKPDKIHTGLLNMSNRMQILKGSFEIITTPGSGAKILITAPY